MGKTIHIKKSPIVIIKNLVFLQFLVAVTYLVAGLVANYGEIYDTFTFSQIVSYEFAKFFFIVAGELLLLVYIFLRWFFASYEFSEGKISAHTGIFWKRAYVWELSLPISVSVSQTPVSKIFKYGSLVVKVKNNAHPLRLMNIPTPHDYRAHILGEEGGDYENDAAINLREYITRREHETLELKASFRWDMRDNRVNRNLEKVVLKTVTAFMNTKGGHLVLGVGDGGEITGLENDFRTLRKQDADGFENHFTNVFNEAVGPEFRQFVRLSFCDIDGKNVCLIRVRPATQPAYMTFDNNERFYIRTGNSTTALALRELPSYVASRWKSM